MSTAHIPSLPFPTVKLASIAQPAAAFPSTSATRERRFCVAYETPQQHRNDIFGHVNDIHPDQLRARKSEIRSAMAAFGKESGFVKKGTTWYRRQAETLAVINLQGSQYGHTYHVNVCLWFCSVDDTEFRNLTSAM